MDATSRDDEVFRISQLTKELVCRKLQESQEPTAVAADLVRQMMEVALRARPEEAEKIVGDACCGGLQGLVLAEQDVARGAATMLEAVSAAANATAMDPTVLMAAALRGFARLSRLVTGQQLMEMRDAIEGQFQGTGAVFSEALEAQPDPGRRETA